MLFFLLFDSEFFLKCNSTQPINVEMIISSIVMYQVVTIESKWKHSMLTMIVRNTRNITLIGDFVAVNIDILKLMKYPFMVIQ